MPRAYLVMFAFGLGSAVPFGPGCAERGRTPVASKLSPSASAPASSRATEVPGTEGPAAQAPASAEASGPLLEAAKNQEPRAAAGGAAGAASDEPSLLAEDGTPLSQTEERPRIDTERFKRRMQLLVEAIRSDQPELASTAFFPLVAYQQVKAIEKPERDYRLRLMTAFARDVHGYHRSFGKDAEAIRFAGVDVPEETARFMKPGLEGNRVGYFRVLRSKLRVLKPDGKERALEITSMISWRGEWYVVHLDGFD